MSSNKVKIGVFLIFLTIISFYTVACLPEGCTPFPTEPVVDIKIHNQTNETLHIFIDGEVFIGKAFPGRTVVWETGSFYPEYKITAKDTDGNTLYIVTWTRDDVIDKETYDVYLPPPEKGTEQGDNATRK